MAEQPNITYGDQGTGYVFMCLRSPNGTLYKLVVDDAGVLTTEVVTP